MSKVNYTVKEIANVCTFDRCSGGNWRNAIHIKCHGCPHDDMHKCDEHMLALTAKGEPILCSAEVYTRVTGEMIDLSECIGTLSRQAFETLFSQWFSWNYEAKLGCRIRQWDEKNIVNTN